MLNSFKIVGIKHWYIEEENKRYMVFLFKTNTYAGVLLNQTEEGDVFWVHKDSLLTLDLAGGFANTFELMNNPKLSEERYFKDIGKTDWECALL